MMIAVACVGLISSNSPGKCVCSEKERKHLSFFCHFILTLGTLECSTYAMPTVHCASRYQIMTCAYFKVEDCN